MYAGGANFTSLFFMNVYSICNNCLICFRPFVDELTKKGRSIWRVYICMFIFVVYAYMSKRERSMLFSLCTLLNIFIVICYAWVKGKLLWSLSSIHAYITSWVLSSSKRGRLLAQRPITLVLRWLTHVVIVY